jgi:hypothetical protein
MCGQQTQAAYEKDPEDCGHGGTIHLGRGYDAAKQCKLCGAKFDRYGKVISND